MRHQAIRALYPPVVTINHLGAYDKDGNVVTITESDVSAKQAELQAEYDAQEYARERQAAYASLGDQLDMQYHDLVDNTTTWKDHISSVKTSFPK